MVLVVEVFVAVAVKVVVIITENDRRKPSILLSQNGEPRVWIDRNPIMVHLK